MGKECRFRLEISIAGQLEEAMFIDFFLPLMENNDSGDEEDIFYGSRSNSKKPQDEEICVMDTSPEVDSMQHIVSLFMSLQTDAGDDSDYSTLYSEGNASSHSSSSNNPSVICNVTKIWDEYLIEIVVYSWLSPAKFLDFVETVPSFNRPAHDQIYKAIHIYLKVGLIKLLASALLLVNIIDSVDISKIHN